MGVALNNRASIRASAGIFLSTTFLLHRFVIFQGNYEKAGMLHECALAIREMMLGPKHPDVTQSLNNQAVLLEKQARVCSSWK